MFEVGFGVNVESGYEDSDIERSHHDVQRQPLKGFQQVFSLSGVPWLAFDCIHRASLTETQTAVIGRDWPLRSFQMPCHHDRAAGRCDQINGKSMPG